MKSLILLVSFIYGALNASDDIRSYGLKEVGNGPVPDETVCISGRAYGPEKMKVIRLMKSKLEEQYYEPVTLEDVAKLLFSSVNDQTTEEDDECSRQQD